MRRPKPPTTAIYRGQTDMRAACLLSVVLTLALCSASWAGAENISPQLRAQAEQYCTGDAIRLCLTSLMDEHETKKCMKTNRNRLSQPCRAVLDRGLLAERR